MKAPLKEIIIGTILVLITSFVTFGVSSYSDNREVLNNDHEKIIVIEKDIEFIKDKLDEISGQTGKIDGVTEQLVWITDRLMEDVKDLEGEQWKKSLC